MRTERTEEPGDVLLGLLDAGGVVELAGGQLEPQLEQAVLLLGQGRQLALLVLELLQLQTSKVS